MFDEIVAALQRAFPDMDLSQINENTRLVDDLGFDSLATIMLSMELEETFNFRFDEFIKFETAGDVCKYIESRKNG